RRGRPALEPPLPRLHRDVKERVAVGNRQSSSGHVSVEVRQRSFVRRAPPSRSSAEPSRSRACAREEGEARLDRGRDSANPLGVARSGVIPPFSVTNSANFVARTFRSGATSRFV